MEKVFKMKKLREVDLFIGIPCSGKSTYKRKNYDEKNIFTISRDDIREELMTKYDMNYSDLFLLPKVSDPFMHEKYGIKTPEGTWSNVDRINEELVVAYEAQKIESILQLQQGKRIVADLTNMTVSERSEIKEIYEGLEAINFNAIVFEFHNNLSTIKSENKIIPDSEIDIMVAKFEPLTNDEGFNVKYVDGLKSLKSERKLKVKIKK